MEIVNKLIPDHMRQHLNSAECHSSSSQTSAHDVNSDPVFGKPYTDSGVGASRRV